MIFNMNGSGASTVLNFKIVGGTTQPSNPSYNTIWINTNTDITSYAFRTTQPTTGAEGMVWIKTASVSSAAFNAIKKNNITVYPVLCKQYISGSWIDKVAKIYQGKWIDWYVYLYNSGDECSAVSGGWTESGYAYGNTSISKDSNSISISATYGDGGNASGNILYARNKIDITNYNTLCFDISNVATQGSNIETAIIVLKNEPDNTTVNFVASMDSTNIAASKIITETGEITLDITSLSGSYYIGIKTYAKEYQTASVTIKSCVLKN